MELLAQLGISFVLTLVLELIFALAWGVRKKDLLLIAVANTITNPVVVVLHYIASEYVILNTFTVIAALETAAIAVEWIIYRSFADSIKKQLLFSLLANAFSFGTGLLFSLLKRLIY